MSKQRRKVLLIACGFSTTFAALPWLGLGHGVFYLDGWDIRLPTINILPKWEFLRQLYNAIWAVAEFPLRLIGNIPPLDSVFFFADEGKVVRPVWVFVFWLAMALFLGWVGFGPSTHTPPDPNLPKWRKKR